MSIIWTPSSFSIVHTRKGFGKAGAAVQWKEIRLPSSAFLEVASIVVVEMVTKEGRWWTGTRRCSTCCAAATTGSGPLPNKWGFQSSHPKIYH